MLCELPYLFSSIVDFVSLVTIEFRLSYIEVISILGRFRAMPQVIIYLVKVIIIIYCDIDNYYQVITSNKVSLVGLNVNILMHEHYVKELGLRTEN